MLIGRTDSSSGGLAVATEKVTTKILLLKSNKFNMAATVFLPFIEKFLVTNWVTIISLFDLSRSFNLFLEAAVLRSRCLL